MVLGAPGPGAGQPPCTGILRAGAVGGQGGAPRGRTQAQQSARGELMWSSENRAHRGLPIPPDPGWTRAGLPAPLGHACGAAPGPQEGRAQRSLGRVQCQPPFSGLRQPWARPPLALQDPGRPLSPWSGKPRGLGEGQACSVSSEPRGLGQRSRGGHQAQGSRSWLVPGRPGVHTPPTPRGCCAASDPRPHLSHGGRGADSMGLATGGGGRGLTVTLTECRRLIFHGDGAQGFLWPACQTGGRPHPGVAAHVSGGKELEGRPVPRVPRCWPRLHVGPPGPAGRAAVPSPFSPQSRRPTVPTGQVQLPPVASGRLRGWLAGPVGRLHAEGVQPRRLPLGAHHGPGLGPAEGQGRVGLRREGAGRLEPGGAAGTAGQWAGPWVHPSCSAPAV